MTSCTLVFHTSQGSAEIQLGKPIDIRIAGGAISAGGPVLAFHANGAWHVGSQRLERIVCKGPMRVEIETQAGRKMLGPFEELSLADDLATSSRGVVARYQPREQTWYFDRYDPECDSFTVRPMPQLAAA